MGNHLAHERAILEIEYLLKKESSRNKNSAIQDEINKYALKRIRCISKWKNLTLEQLDSLRKTYSKLRPFFLKGQWLTGKIPDYCYENYYTCFCLIYDYVEKYTPPELLDIAYFILDDTYTLYSYSSLICNDKMSIFKYMNENTIPDQCKMHYQYLCTHFMWAFNKIYFFIMLSRLYCDRTVCDWPDCNRTVCKESPNTLFMREFTQYIKICRNKLHETSHESFSNLSMKRVPSLDGFILYNILWNNYIMIPQSIFMKEFLRAANIIDPKFGKLQMAFELIGIDFEISGNRNIYNDIIEMIQDKNARVNRDILINYLLRKIYKDKEYLKADGSSDKLMHCLHAKTEDGRTSDMQKAILNMFKKELSRYIIAASGNSGSDMWDKGNAEMLTYQFIYRNCFGLGKPDILPGSITANMNIVEKFLEHYNLKLFRYIRVGDCPWLKYALTNLKKNPREYNKHMHCMSGNYLKLYTKLFIETDL